MLDQGEAPDTVINLDLGGGRAKVSSQDSENDQGESAATEDEKLPETQDPQTNSQAHHELPSMQELRQMAKNADAGCDSDTNISAPLAVSLDICMAHRMTCVWCRFLQPYKKPMSLWRLDSSIFASMSKVVTLDAVLHPLSFGFLIM